MVDTINEPVVVVEDLLTGERKMAHATRLRRYADALFEVNGDARDHIAYNECWFCVGRIADWRNTEAVI